MTIPRIILLNILFFLSLGTWAQDSPAGEWTVQGENPQGTAYQGELDIEAISGDFYRLAWDVDYGEAEEQLTFPGTGFYRPSQNVMFAAYGIGNLRYGLCIYPLNEKGGLEGEGDWTSHRGIGSELLAGKLNRSSIVGTYEVVGTRSKGDVEIGASESYTGTLRISKRDDNIYVLKWFLGDGLPYSGFAYKTNGYLIGVWGVGSSYGLEKYEFSEDMQTAEATWISPNNGLDATGQETIERQ